MLELHPNGHTVYALGNEFGGFIAVADLQRDIDYATYSFVRGQAQTSIDFQTDLALHPDGTRAFLPGSIGPAEVLFVMDTSDPWTPTLQRVIDLPEVIDFGARPVRIALAHDGLRAYLLSRNDSVTVIETVSGAVVATINVPSEEGEIVIGPGDAPASPSPVEAGSQGGCAVTNSEQISAGPALLAVIALGWLWMRRSRWMLVARGRNVASCGGCARVRVCACALEGGTRWPLSF